MWKYLFTLEVGGGQGEGPKNQEVSSVILFSGGSLSNKAESV